MNEPATRTGSAIVVRVRDLLNTLHGADIPYCLLRNHEPLTEDAPCDNTDFDILVRSGDLSRIGPILRDAGFVRTRESTVRRHIGYMACIGPPGQILALDLHLDHPSWNDIPYFPGDRLLSENVAKSSTSIPCDSHTAALLVLHSILDKKAFKEKYIQILDHLLEGGLDPDTVESLFAQTVGERLAGDLTAALTRRDYPGLLALRHRVIQALLDLRPVAWANLLLCLWRSRWKRLHRRLFPCALLVALIGPDGAGKSTVGDHLKNRLAVCGIPVHRFYMGRWHSHILPLAGIARTQGASAKADPSPQPADPRAPADPVHLSGRPLYRLVRDAVYLAEMALRYALRLWPALRRGGVVLTDRYAFDLLLDPNATVLAHLALTRIFPRPHLCFYLHQDAETLQKRKQEQSLFELQRQLDVFARYQARLGFIPILSENLDKNVHEIFQPTVLKYITRS